MAEPVTAHAARVRPTLPAAWRWPLRAVAAVLGVLVLAYAILWITKGRFLKPTFVRLASRYAERPVRVGGDFQLYFNPHVKFLAEDIAVANPRWAKDDQLFEAAKVDAELSTLRLIFGNRRFRFLNIERGDIALEWNTARQNTWTFRDRGGEPFELPVIRRAAITGTTLSYADPALDLTLGVRIDDIAAQNTTLPAIAFRGQGRSRGAPFQLAGRITAPNETMRGGENRLEARIDVGDSRLDITGTLPGATELEGSDLKLASRGGNLATPFTLLGAKIPDTRRYNVTSNLTKRGIEWRLTDIRGRFGDSDLRGTMTASLPEDRLLIVADLRSDKLDILDAGPWIGYEPKALVANGAIHTVAGRPRVLPDGPLDADSLERFDAQVKYRAGTVRTGAVGIADLDLGLDLERRLLKLDPLSFDIAGGRLSATIAINARDPRVVTDYDIRLSPVSLGRVLTSFDVENSGTTATVRGRVQLRGYGDTVHKSLASSSGRLALVLPAGALWVRNVELAELDVAGFLAAAIGKGLKDPVTIRCGLLGFTVRDGLATADPLIIDTNRNVITGRGGFSFRDEAVDMAVEADSKRFSLFSGQSPIAIRGSFADPKINPISGKLLTRVGVGIGLAVVASPIALLAAFVDLGDADDADCGPILRAASGREMKAAGRTAKRREG